VFLAMSGPCFSLTQKPSKLDTDPSPFWKMQLAEQRRLTFDGGYTEADFAKLLMGSLEEGASSERVAQWRTGMERVQKQLQNAHKKQQGVLCDQRVPVGGTKMQWRWFICDQMKETEARAAAWATENEEDWRNL
jgi:hypothetical protein